MANLDDYAWLTGDPAATALLIAFAGDARPELQQLSELRKSLPPERARLLIEQVALRRRAVNKFGPLTARLFFTPIQLEQATDRDLAAYKAERFRRAGGARLIHDYCCGIGGDLLAFAATGPACGWELSPIIQSLAQKNVAALRTDGTAVDPAAHSVRQADVAQLTPAANDLWHVDPDRRAAGRRTTTLELHSPGPELIDRWRNVAHDGAVKLSPASEPPDEWQASGELEWVSVHRECRQLVVWFGSLAANPGERRATVVLPKNDAEERNYSASRSGTFVGDADRSCSVANEPLRYIYDPDPALIAGHLLGAIAEERRLQSLGPGGVYLTGDHELSDPLLTAFAVTEVLPPRVATVAGWLAARGVGRVEVKKRGVPTDPEKFRRGLKLRGDAEATVILTRIGVRQVAIIAHRPAVS